MIVALPPFPRNYSRRRTVDGSETRHFHVLAHKEAKRDDDYTYPTVSLGQA